MLATAFHDLATVMELAISRWQQLFEFVEFNVAEGVADHPAVFSLLTSGALPPELEDAIETIGELGTENGRDALIEAAADQNLDIHSWAEIDAPREFALRIWIESRSNEVTRQVLMRARLRINLAPAERAFREFAGKRAFSPPPVDYERIRSRITQWCASHGRGESALVVQYNRDRDMYFEIVHGHLVRTQLAIDRSGRPEILQFRPGHSDQIRYEPDTGRLGIRTRSATMVPFYCEVFGELLAGDREFFAGENICTLKPLQDNGRVALSTGLAAIASVHLVELLWEAGDRERIWIKSHDCFDILEETLHGVRRGRFLEAKIEIRFSTTARPTNVTIKVPNRISYRPGPNDHLVERFLAEIGIRGTFVDADGTRPDDLWTLSPWRHDEATWRGVLGQDFDHLRRRGHFRAISSRSVSHPDHPERGPVLEVHAVDSHQTYGVSSDDDVPSRSLTTSDIAGFELKPEVLATEIAAALGMVGGVSEVVAGIWELGQLDLGSGNVIAPFLVARPPGPGTTDVIGRHSIDARPILIVPEGRKVDLGLLEISTPLPGGPSVGLLRRIVRALELRNVSPLVLAREGARLVVDARNGQVWLDRTLLSSLQKDSQPYKFVVAIAEAGGTVVSKLDLKQLIGAMSDDGVVKQAKSDAVNHIRRSFEAANVPPPTDLTRIFAASRGNGYSAAIECDIVR